MSVKEAKTQEQSDHDYTMEVSTISKRKDNVPTTPSKIPAGKKCKTSLKEAEVSILAILEAIQSLEKNFNEQLSQLREQAKQTSTMVASLAKAVQFNAEEVKECKGKINELERCNDRLSKENVELKERIREQERYKMRCEIAPDMERQQLEEAVDIVHRVGRKEDNRSRHVVVLFVRRFVKEELWRQCKDSRVCREKGVRLAEMLPREDREAREKLWPQIEQARRDGKRAYFRGPHGYIEGRRIATERERGQGFEGTRLVIFRGTRGGCSRGGGREKDQHHSPLWPLFDPGLVVSSPVPVVPVPVVPKWRRRGTPSVTVPVDPVPVVPRLVVPVPVVPVPVVQVPVVVPKQPAIVPEAVPEQPTVIQEAVPEQPAVAIAAEKLLDYFSTLFKILEFPRSIHVPSAQPETVHVTSAEPVSSDKMAATETVHVTSAEPVSSDKMAAAEPVHVTPAEPGFSDKMAATESVHITPAEPVSSDKMAAAEAVHVTTAEPVSPDKMVAVEPVSVPEPEPVVPVPVPEPVVPVPEPVVPVPVPEPLVPVPVPEPVVSVPEPVVSVPVPEPVVSVPGSVVSVPVPEPVVSVPVPEPVVSVPVPWPPEGKSPPWPPEGKSPPWPPEGKSPPWPPDGLSSPPWPPDGLSSPSWPPDELSLPVPVSLHGPGPPSLPLILHHSTSRLDYCLVCHVL
ncbi:unnamed protein product [Leuciscus chuanchicus]